MRIAILVKQIPKFEEMELGADGRLRRDGIGADITPVMQSVVDAAVEQAALDPQDLRRSARRFDVSRFESRIRASLDHARAEGRAS